MEKVNQRVEIREVGQVNKIDVFLGILIGVVCVWSYYAIEPYEYHGDEDELAHERDQKEENDPRHEPNFDDKEGK